MLISFHNQQEGERTQMVVEDSVKFIRALVIISVIVIVLGG
jgi:hypothetical protein